MYSVANANHETKPKPQRAQSEPTKDYAAAEIRHPPVAGHNPRPPAVEDDMATCG
jgi:hypothetical protein